jgi:uncharacterized protein YjaZ
MAISATGNKSKSRSSNTSNQTQTNTLSDRAAGMLSQGIADASGRTYQRFNPADIAQYQSPYTESVINASLDQADRRDAIARNEQKAQFAGAGAFGDDRRGIYEAELAGAQSRDRASMIAALNDQAFGQAREIAQSEGQNANQYDLAIQQLLAQLRSQFGNEGTQTMQGSSLTKNTGSGFSMGASYGGK